MNAYAVALKVRRERKNGEVLEGYMAPAAHHGITPRLSRALLFDTVTEAAEHAASRGVAVLDVVHVAAVPDKG